MKNKHNNGWIAVSVRLPDLDTPVWAGWFDTNGTFAFGLFVLYTEDSFHYWARCSHAQSWNNFGDWELDDDYSHITHWQPLPEPPKG